MGKLSKRDILYNAVLKAVKENSSGMMIGAVTAVLGEVEGDICRKVPRHYFDTIQGELKMRVPRE